MRWFFVVSLFGLLNSLAAAQVDQDLDDNGRQTEVQSSVEPRTPLEIIIVDDLTIQDPRAEQREQAAIEREQADLRAQQGMLDATVETNDLTVRQIEIAWLETLLALASVILAGLALAISIQANSHAKTGTRAWLKIVPNVRPYREGDISFEVTMENVGTAPATEIEVECQTGYVIQGTSDFIRDGETNDPKGFVVFPGDKGAGCGWLTMTKEQYSDQVAAGKLPAFYVQLKYKSGAQGATKMTEAVIKIAKVPSKKSFTFTPAFAAGTYLAI